MRPIQSICMRMTAADMVLTVLPMFHVGGLNIQTIPALFAGATVVLLRQFDVDHFTRRLMTHPVTLTLIVPTIMLLLMAIHVGPRASRPVCESFRSVQRWCPKAWFRKSVIGVFHWCRFMVLPRPVRLRLIHHAEDAAA